MVVRHIAYDDEIVVTEAIPTAETFAADSFADLVPDGAPIEVRGMPSSAVSTFTDPDDYYGGAYGSHGGTYYGGTAVVTPGYPGWGAAAAGAVVGATTAAAVTAAIADACAAPTYNYYPPPYYRPPAAIYKS